MMYWVNNWLNDWLTKRLSGWLTSWLPDWLKQWLSHWLTERLTYWLYFCLFQNTDDIPSLEWVIFEYKYKNIRFLLDPAKTGLLWRRALLSICQCFCTPAFWSYLAVTTAQVHHPLVQHYFDSKIHFLLCITLPFQCPLIPKIMISIIFQFNINIPWIKETLSTTQLCLETRNFNFWYYWNKYICSCILSRTLLLTNDIILPGLE